MMMRKLFSNLPRVLPDIYHHPISQGFALGKMTSPNMALDFFAQDNLYLSDYRKVIELISQKLKDEKQMKRFQEFSMETIAAEHLIQELYLKQFNFTSIVKTEVTSQYTNYLLSQATNAPVEIAVASVLPCFVIYEKWGQYLKRVCRKKDNPYYPLVSGYWGDDFLKSVRDITSITETLASSTSKEIRGKMVCAFDTSVDYEVKFFNQFTEEKKLTYQNRLSC